MSCNEGAEEPASIAEEPWREIRKRQSLSLRGRIEEGQNSQILRQSQAWSVLNGVRIELIQDILYYRCKNHEHGAFGK